MYSWYSAPRHKPPSNRERLLEIAQQLVLQKGFASTSIEELTAGVGMLHSFLIGLKLFAEMMALAAPRPG